MEARNHTRGDDSSPALPDLPTGTQIEDYYSDPRRSRRTSTDSIGMEDSIETISHVGENPRRRGVASVPPSRRSTSRGTRLGPLRNDDVIVSLRQKPVTTASVPHDEAVRAPFVLPSVRELASQTVPSAVMAITLAAAAAVGEVSLFGIPLWAFAVTIPTLLVLFLSNGVLHPLWKEASIVNLIAILVVFPVLVVRQSVSRIPFTAGVNGTLLAPVATTILVVGLLIGAAILCAVLSREDPEYAGVIFLPVAMFVPFFAGAGDITNLRTATLMAVAIFVVTAALTVVATMVPSRYAVAIAPGAIMVEFLVLAAARGADVFPLGAGVASKVLFFAIVTCTVALTILVPLLTFWMQQVTLIMRSNFSRMASGIA